MAVSVNQGARRRPIDKNLTNQTIAAKLPHVTMPIPGPKSRAIFDREQSFIAPGRQRISLLAGVAFDHGDGATLTDADGNVYLDFFAGVAVPSLGHAPPVMSEAIARQASRPTDGSFATAERAECFQLLSEAAPAGLRRAHLYSRGAGAGEAGLRLARSGTKKHGGGRLLGRLHGKTRGGPGHDRG